MLTGSAQEKPMRSVADALRECRLLFVFAALFGVAVNILMLAGPLYMLQIYDRVLSSGSIQTLVALSLLVLAAYATLAVIDSARSGVLAKASLRLDRLLTEPLVRGSWRHPKGADFARGAELQRDVDTYRDFAFGPGALAAIDLPFAPFFIGVIYLLHPWLGVFAAASAALLGVIALLTQLATRGRAADAQREAQSNNRFVMSVAARAETVRALGMTGPLINRWREERDLSIGHRAVAQDRSASFRSLAKGARFAVQSLILGLGAYLVLIHELTAGGMIAASILLGRALAPIEQAIQAWSQLHAARAARRALDEALGAFSQTQFTSAGLPTQIRGEVAFDKLTFHPARAAEALFSDLAFRVPPGVSVGVVGPSGAGKSSLARLIVGALAPTRGCVRIDGADVRSLDPDRLGPSIGYLDQNAQLLDGAVRENIARFQLSDDERVYRAALSAGVHETILRLPDGYDTRIGGADGHGLSAGQRQRIGLARALFGDPRLIVLDEPNSNLDDSGDRALAQALAELAERKATVFIVSHKRDILEAVDALLVLGDARGVIFGKRSAVIQELSRRSGGGARALPSGGPGGDGPSGAAGDGSGPAGSPDAAGRA